MTGDGAAKPRREYSDRPPTNYSDRPRREYSARPRSDFSDRPRGDFSDRPRGDFPDRPRGAPVDRSRDDFPDRPRGAYVDRPRDDRPRGNFSDRARPYGDRPRRPPFDARRPYTARVGYVARPQHESPVDRDALVGEGEELIAGRRPVEEAFAARRDSVRLLIVPERRAALDALAIHATTLRIPVVEVEGGTLTALAGFDGHQGVALVARPRVPGDVDTILARARERDEAPFILVLDSLEDPQNFGTLLRSAEACGVHGVIYPTRRSAPLSPAAIKASAGATEHLVLAAVDDLAATLADLHGDGLRVAGADEEASLSYVDADLRGPLAIVVGSEGRGMSGPVHRRLDLTVRIPMRGKIGSLNAAVAGSILLFAAAGQRPTHEQETAPVADPARDDVPAADEATVPAKTKRTTKRTTGAKAVGEATSTELLPGDS
jgi:23S rRNA (guanosine2251-2'-O)-methyltransferase